MGFVTRISDRESGNRSIISPVVSGDKKVKLLYIIDCLNIGGTEKQLIELINRLDREKFDLYLCCLRESEYLQKQKLDCHVLVLDVYTLVSIQGLRKLIELSQYIRSRNIDIVQTFFIDANVFGTIASKLGGARAVISSRRDMAYWYTPVILYVLRFLRYFTTRYLVNSCNVRDYVSAKEWIPKEKIDVLYNGIDISRFSAENINRQSVIFNEIRATSDDAIVGIVSNLNRSVKRVDIFLLAAAEILGRGFKAIFVIVGEGQLKEKLLGMCKELGILDKVRFVGSQENVLPYIQSFTVAVNSSESEGLSNAVLEYMACGVPVVATNFGGSSESVIHAETGLLVSPNNPVEMADAIIELLNDPEKARSMGARGRDRIESNFSFEVVVGKQEQYYMDVLSQDRIVEKSN